jgi:hypothetical protein
LLRESRLVGLDHGRLHRLPDAPARVA